jgi:hypothetical protein
VTLTPFLVYRYCAANNWQRLWMVRRNSVLYACV